MKSYYSYLLIGLFLAAISAPLLIMQLSEEQTISTAEKRTLAAKPVLELSYQSVNEFPALYEKYFNDHFGLRDRFVTLYDSLIISLLRTSPKSHTIVGKEKWLYHAAEFVLDDFLGMRLRSPEYLLRWKEILLEREEWLADRGIKYLFLTPPNKVMIYPEYLPDRFFIRRDTTFLQQFTEYLAQAPVFSSTLDLRPFLLEAKKNNLVYFKADTHWNYNGSYAAYEAIINRISRWFPELKPTPKNRMSKEDKELYGDLSHRLHVEDMYVEEVSFLHIPDSAKKINYTPYDDYPKMESPYLKLREGTVFTNENPEMTLTAIFISDSFGSALRDFMTQHFKRIVFVKDTRFENVLKLIEKEKPDIVFDLNVARGINVAMGRSREVSDYIAKKRFPQAKSLMQITAENLADNIIQTNLAEIGSDLDNGLIIAGEGDSQLFLKLPQDVVKDRLLIHCIINSPVDTITKIYFQTPDKPYYCEEHTVFSYISKGTNDFYLRINEPTILNSIRFDPGEVAGDYRLRLLSFSR